MIVHNSFIQVLGELGIAGFIPFMIFVFGSLYQAWRMEKGPVGAYAMALGSAMWGFVMSSLSGGFTYTWWPYILVGLIAAAKRITESRKLEAA
jgi:O-antigen ligase